MKHALIFCILLFCIQSNAQVPKKNGDKEGSGSGGSEFYDIAIPDDEVVKPSRENSRAGYYKKDGLYGFVFPKDSQQSAIYNEIKYGINGFIVKKGSLYGIADKQGKLLVKIEFDSIWYSYQNGNSYIVKKKDKFGTISETAKPILSTKYSKILFCDKSISVSFVESKNGEMQMVYNDQEKIFPSKIEYVELYANLYIVKVNGKFGLLKDKIILPFEYDSIFYRSMDESDRNVKAKKASKQLLYNFSKYHQIIPVLTIQMGGKYGLANSDGTIVYPAENDLVNNKSAYQYYTVKKENLFGIYFIKSKSKTALEFDKVYADGIGFVMATKNKKAGVFNLSGEQIVPFEYDDDFIAQLSGVGLRVTKNKKRGIVDLKGNILVPPIYDEVDTYYEHEFREFIKVKIGEKFGIVNLKGDTIIPIEFDGIATEKGFFKAIKREPDRKVGLYDKTGKVIIPAEYLWIGKSDTRESNITLLTKDTNSYYFLNENNQLIFPENTIEYGYVLDQDRLLNPFSKSGNFLFYVKGENGKAGMINELSGTLDIPLVYDKIIQRFERGRHTYLSVKKDGKFGVINEQNQIAIPIQYDAISLDLIESVYSDELDSNLSVVVRKGNKMGTVNFKNQMIIPFKYDDLQRISFTGLYKAKIGATFKIINSKNEVVSNGPFDEVANFEIYGADSEGSGEQLLGYFESAEEPIFQALTFYKGKMKVINSKGVFISSEGIMRPHRGYTTFDEMKYALIRALDSKEDLLLKDFVEKIAPSQHILFYLTQNLFDSKTSLEYTDINFVKEKYLNDLLRFKSKYWNQKSDFGYNRASLTEVTDYTIDQSEYVTNKRLTDPAFGDTRFMEKLLRNALKVNGYWISTYFMIRNFESFKP